MKAIQFNLYLLCTLIILSTQILAQQDIVPDSTFGVNGKIQLVGGDSTVHDKATDFDFLPDGRIRFCGETILGGQRRVLHGQLMSEGGLDSSFRNGGLFVDGDHVGSNGNWYNQPFTKMIQKGNGKTIVINGTSVYQYLTNGQPDSTFGNNGKSFSFQSCSFPLGCTAFDLGQVSDSVTVVVGRKPAPPPYNDYDFGIISLQESGSLSSPSGQHSFFSISDEIATCVAIQSDGKILVGGYVESQTNQISFLICRLLASGQLDLSFNSSGYQEIDFFGGTISAIATSILLQPDGKILLGGRLFNQGIEGFGLCRLNQDGSLDTSFNGTGKAHYSSELPTGAFSMALQKDSTIVIGGYEGEEILLARFTHSGLLDPYFGSGGLFHTEIGSGIDVPYALQLDQEGRILIAGTTEDTVHGHYELFLARYLNNFPPKDPASGIFEKLEPKFALHLFPNPAYTKEIQLNYTLSKSSLVSIILQDPIGQQVEILASGLRSFGKHEEILNLPDSINTGLYILQFHTSEGIASMKLQIK